MFNFICSIQSIIGFNFFSQPIAQEFVGAVLDSKSTEALMCSAKSLNSSQIDLKDTVIIGSGLFYLTSTVKLVFVENQLITISILAAILYYLSKLLSKKIFNLAKKSAYECGFEPFLLIKAGIEVGFILVGFIFLIFDLELVFLLAFLIAAGSIGGYGILICSTYIATVWAMILFEIRTGILSWPVWNIFKVR